MFRQIPQANKICSKRILELEQQRMEERLRKVQAYVDSSQPQSFDIAHKGRNWLQNNQFTEVERVNCILLEKLTKVMSKDTIPLRTSSPQVNNNCSIQGLYQGNTIGINNMQQPSQIQIYHSIQKPFFRSLNSGLRKRELIKIAIENQQLLQRLKHQRSNYEYKKQLKDWIESQERVSRISEFGKPQSAKGFTGSRSLPRNKFYKTKQEININNMQEMHRPNQNSLKSLSASVHVLKRNEISGKDCEKENNPGAPQMMGLKKVFSSGFLGKSGRVLRNKNSSSNHNVNVTEAGKKHILCKKSKRIGQELFLLELSIENGVLQIIADEVKKPNRQILEMCESDGLFILQKYYRSSPAVMLENVIVTEERISLKGLDKRCFEQFKKSSNEDFRSPIVKLENQTVRDVYRSNSLDDSKIIEEIDQESCEMSPSNLDNKDKQQNKQQKKQQEQCSEYSDEFDECNEELYDDDENQSDKIKQIKN